MLAGLSAFAFSLRVDERVRTQDDEATRSVQQNSNDTLGTLNFQRFSFDSLSLPVAVRSDLVHASDEAAIAQPIIIASSSFTSCCQSCYSPVHGRRVQQDVLSLFPSLSHCCLHQASDEAWERVREHYVPPQSSPVRVHPQAALAPLCDTSEEA